MGDGTFGEGALYEAMNLSHLIGSKILFVVEDNSISQTTPSKTVLSGSLQSKFDAFNIPVLSVDSAAINSFLELSSRLNNLWNESPILGLVVESYRLNSHSKGDDSRSLETLNVLKDPLKIFADYLKCDFDNMFEKKLEDVKHDWVCVLRELDQVKSDFFSSNLVKNEREWTLNQSGLRLMNILEMR